MTKRSLRRGLPGRALLAAVLSQALAACDISPPAGSAAPAAALWPRPQADAAATADWPSYNRDLAGTRYSTLKQITAENVGDLQQAWTYELGAAAAGNELTPLVVAGVLYAAAEDRIVALHAHSGAEIWRHATARPPRRSLAYWPGQEDHPARLYYVAGRRLIALDAASGAQAAEFGRDGEMELASDYDFAPTRFENLLIVGSTGAPGGLRALDARTGTEVWRFTGIPRAGDPEAATWVAAGDDAPTFVPHEAVFTIDVDRAVLYAAFGGPAPSAEYGGGRLGDTLFANSIVALDVRTGRRRWHFQTVRHDVWDYDLPAAPVLLDAEVRGELAPLLALASEAGYLYVLNRVTGEPQFGIEERPVPPSAAPGEQTAPTQPLPPKPAPLARLSFAAADLATANDTSAEHAAACRALVEQSGALSNAGPFTPYAYRSSAAPTAATLLFPGARGGPGWGGAAADPGSGFVFVTTSDVGTLGWLEADLAGDGLAAARRDFTVEPPVSDAPGEEAGSGGSSGPWPCQKPPWGRLLAIHAATGDVAWQVPLGVTHELPEGRRRTGRPSSGGPIATAGELVFVAATDDRRLRAFAARSGEELWVAELPASAHAVPTTYAGNDGKQYVAVVAAGPRAGAARGGRPTLVAFGLP